MSKKRIEEINREITKLEIEKIECEKNLYLTCKGRYDKGCGKRKKIKNLIMFRGYYYTSTYGCNGGGNYVEDSFLQYLCPYCGVVADVKDSDPVFRSARDYCKRLIIYSDLNQGDIVRKRQFKMLMQENQIER